VPRKVDGTVDDERYDSMNLAVRFDDCFALGVLTAERPDPPPLIDAISGVLLRALRA